MILPYAAGKATDVTVSPIQRYSEYMKKQLFALGLILAVMFSGSAAVFADTYASGSATVAASSSFPCVSFDQSFGFGSRNPHVVQLQQYLGISPTGYFGPLTRGKLQIFQSTHGIPATGFFGPLSRAFLGNLICGTNPPPTNAPVISYLSPTSGAVGTSVTITGSGFDSNSYVLIDGGSSGAVFSNDGTHITFAIPSYVGANCNHFLQGSVCPMYARLISPGVHSVSVTTKNGTCNSVNFTVTDTTCPNGACGSNRPPVISGGSFPTTLTVGQTGTWTVNASDPENGSLSYGVNWGDSNQCTYPYACAGVSASASVQQTSTFTHSYANPGTYTITFVVTDTGGLTAQTSTTVQVGNNQTAAPTISYLAPSSGAVGTTVTIHGSGFTATGNHVNFADATAWGAGTYSTEISSPDGMTLSFVVPASKGACPPGAYCTLVYWPPYQPGLYSVSVTNVNGTSNSSTFAITDSNDSGINGTVTVGPTCPVQYYPPQPQCADRPYQTTLNIQSQNPTIDAVRTVSSDANGRFSVTLPPGTYTISQASSSVYPRLSPQTVTVYAHQYANVNLTFDSGIR